MTTEEMTLFDDFYSLACWLAARMTSRAVLARIERKDMRQIAAVTLIAIIRTWRPGRATFRCWFFAQFRNRMADELRALRIFARAGHAPLPVWVPLEHYDGSFAEDDGQRHNIAPEAMVVAPVALDEAIDRDRRERVMGLLARLPDRQRGLVTARLRGEAPRAAALRCGVTVGHASQLIRAAVTKLRKAA